MKTEQEQLVELIHQLVDHLNYCGWGDKWEREVSEQLRKDVQEFENKYPRKE